MAVFTLGIGIVAAAVLTPLMSIMLFGVGTMDPIHVACVTILLTTFALAACCIPTRRAMRTDPMFALRYE